MSQSWKSPLVNGSRDGGMTPFRTPPQRNDSPKHWSAPDQNRQSRNWSSSPSNWSPQHYNSRPSPDGYWGHQRQWSPNQWDPASTYRRSWGSTPKTPKYSPSYRQSPEHGSGYPERKKQVPFRRIPKDIGIYYSPSMVEDPWAQLEAKASISAESK